MAEIKIAADSGGGFVSLKGPASTTGNATIDFNLGELRMFASETLDANPVAHLDETNIDNLSNHY